MDTVDHKTVVFLCHLVKTNNLCIHYHFGKIDEFTNFFIHIDIPLCFSKVEGFRWKT